MCKLEDIINMNHVSVRGMVQLVVMIGCMCLITTTSADDTAQGLDRIIFSLAWSPDGSTIAVGQFGRVELVDAVSGATIKHLTGSGGPITAVDWSSDSTRVAGASANPNGVAIWNINTGQMMVSRQNDAIDLAWSPDDSQIAYASMQGGVGLWNIENGQMNSLQLPVTEVQWRPDGTQLAVADNQDDPITIIDTTTWEADFTLIGHINGVVDVEWSPDSTQIASAGIDSNVRFWNAATGSFLFELSGHTGIVSAIAWNQNNRVLASSGADGTVRFWDTQTAQPLDIVETGGQVGAIAWNPSGDQLVYGGEAGIVTILDYCPALVMGCGEDHSSIIASQTITPLSTLTPLDTLIAQTTLPSRIDNVLWSPDRQLIAVVGEFGIRILDDTLQLIATPQGHTGRVWSVSWKPDSSALVTASEDGTMRIWLRNLSTNAITLDRILGIGTTTRNRSINVAVWSPNGLFLATLFHEQPGLQDNFTLAKIQIWNTTTWTSTIYTSEYQFPWVELEWSPDSSQILGTANSCDNPEIMCTGLPYVFSLNVSTGTFSRLLDIVTIPALDWQQDRLVFSIPRVEIYQASTMQLLSQFNTIDPLGSAYEVIQWSPAGTRLVAGYVARGQVDFINAATGQIEYQITSPDRLSDLDWNSDGTRLVIARENNRAEVWDTTALSDAPSSTGGEG
jgi:WD40 repeat protein